MLVIKIEIWPYGNKKVAQTIGCVTIVNDGTAFKETGTHEIGNYIAALGHSGKYQNKKGAWKQCEIKGFNRQKSVYHLLYLVLKACLYPKKTKKK